ncbi:MAG: helix-turn-helix transcriptional regulator [Candidatus Limnocylindria bacterium]
MTAEQVPEASPAASKKKLGDPMTKPALAREIEALTMLREPTRRALYEHVARQPDAVSRDEAAAVVGINRPLAAFHLDRLVGAGLLSAEYRRLSGRGGPGAGRPAKLYRRSSRQVTVSLPPRDPGLLASVLAASMASADPEIGSFAAAREVGHALGSRARRRLRGDPTAARLVACVQSVLDTMGFEPYRRTEGEIRLRNCPFDPLSRRFTPIVCGAGLELARGVVEGVGADGLHVTRDERPDQCCLVLAASPTATVVQR